jgi:hypothetical protein
MPNPHQAAIEKLEYLSFLLRDMLKKEELEDVKIKIHKQINPCNSRGSAAHALCFQFLQSNPGKLSEIQTEEISSLIDCAELLAEILVAKANNLAHECFSAESIFNYWLNFKIQDLNPLNFAVKPLPLLLLDKQ